MILRLAQNLKDQNWTAIAIEFVLLVLGVFLGIQVANWNVERDTTEKSAIFTERWREKGWPAGCRELGDSDFQCGIDAQRGSTP